MVIFGNVLTNTSSPFYQGVTLIGWTLSTTANASSYTSCGTTATLDTGEIASVSNCITATNGAGVLAVVGIIGLAMVVTEFISW